MNPMEELERGQLAADILGNRLYVETMKAIAEDITTRWQSEVDEAKREHLWRMNQCHKRFEALLSEALTTGKIRQKQVEAEQSRLDRAKGLLRRVG